MRVAVVQHVPYEPPGAYTAVLRRFASVDTFLAPRDGVPDLTAYEAAVVMGGPMGVYDVDEYPWLAAEIAGMAAALASGTAIWGVCLGAQLLAAAGGAQVRAGPAPEVGVKDVQLTRAAAGDAVFEGLPQNLPVLQWHGDTFELPIGADLLATGSDYPHQAFRLGRSYGLQFHLEAPWDLARTWLEMPAYRQSLERAGGPGAPEQLEKDLSAAEADMTATAQDLIARWLEGLSRA